MKKQALLMFLAIFSFLSTYATQKVENYNTKQPSVFYPNKGQIIDQDRKVRKDVRYHYSAPGFALSITDKGMSWTVTKTERFEKKASTPSSAMAEATPPKEGNLDSLVFHTHRVDVEFVGANMMIPIEEAQVQGYYQNFYTEYTGEQGITNLHGAKQITLKNVWNGIDIVFQAKEEGKLEYDFVLHPNANIKDIQLKYNGQNAMNLFPSSGGVSAESGRGGFSSLVFQTSVGEVSETIPMSYEKENSKAVTVDYQLNNNIVSFTTKTDYNKQNTLVIDPQLVWGTYYGGSGNDYGDAIALDGSGNVYITGSTSSTTGIATSGAHKTSLGGNISDAFIAKFNTSGVRQWGSYYGGSSGDGGNGIAVDGSGNVYITGSTISTSGIATSGAHQTSYGGGWDAFIAKFNTSGVRQWGSYCGGSDGDYGYGIAVDGSGNVYITGHTGSTSGIATSGAHQTSYGGGRDAYLAKFNTSGVRQWGSYYGGSGNDWGYGIAVDGSGYVYITGWAQSTSGIATSGVHQTSNAGADDVFIAKFDTSGVRQWGSYYGGHGQDIGYGIALDGSGNVYITGWTSSTSGIATSGAHQTTFAGGFSDVLIAKFNTSGVRQWGSYYGGGTDWDRGNKIITDYKANLYITGYTQSTSGIANGLVHQTSNGGFRDVFVTNLDTNGIVQWGSYYGGGDNDYGQGICLDTNNNIYFIGNTSSSTRIATLGSHKTNFGGGDYDVFLVKLLPCSTYAGKNTIICFGDSIQIGATSQIGHFYKWTSIPSSYNSSISNPFVKPTITTTYYLYDTSKWGCIGNDSVTITVNMLPNITVRNDTAICLGTTVSLGGTSNTNYSYLWSSKPSGFSSSNSNPYVKPSQITKYYLEATDKVTKCINKDSITVTPNRNLCSNGYLSLHTDTSLSPFDTLKVAIKVNNASNIYSLFARLKLNPDIFYLQSSKRGNFLGNTIINLGAIDNPGYIDLGITKTGSVSGSNGTDTFYTLKLLVNNSFPTKDTRCLLELDSIIAYNSSGQRVNVGYDTFVVNYRTRAIVWPGDLNNDFKVDITDILPIGYFYNQTGSKRPNASFTWIGQPAPLWGTDKSSVSSSGYRVFADADGNGVVGLADITGIGLNLGKSHNKTTNYKEPSLPKEVTGAPYIRAVFPDTFVLRGDLPKKMAIPIMLGKQGETVSNLYGIAVDLYIDPSYINTSQFSIDYSKSIFGKESDDFIKIEDEDIANGRISIGITRFNTSEISGFGELFTLNLELNASNSGGKAKLYSIVKKGNDKSGSDIALNSSVSELKIETVTSLGNQAVKNEHNIQLYPNPAENSMLTIQGVHQSANLRITDMNGKTLFQQPLQASERQTVNTNLPQGMYLVEIQLPNQVVMKKWMVR